MKAITECRACGSEELIEFLDLGSQYLSDFRDDKSKTPKYPLVSVFCEHCKLVQLKHTTPQHEMYHDRYGFKSGISDSIKADLDDVVTTGFQYCSDPQTWLDIASNDGTLLSFVPNDVFRVGVDPVTFLCKEAEQHADLIVNDFFNADYFTEDRQIEFDVITSVSCFYDMPDPNKFVSDVAKVLNKSHGIWVIQQNYLLTTMELSAVDNICHEHLEYYTLSSLERLLRRHNLEVVEVQTSMVNGGSLRTMVAHKGVFDVDDSVYVQRDKETDYGVESIECYQDFAEKVMGELDKLRRMVIEWKEQGKTVAILAASTRGATIWQSAELDEKLIDYAVERNPAKVGRYFTAIGVPIISEEDFRSNQPDYAIIGPWFFGPEIIEREQEFVDNGGTLVMPLPKVELISKPSV